MNIVKDVYQKRVLILALFAGEIMMKSGAEISRVEDTIVRICRACKIDYVECFATITGIFLALDVDNKDADMHTFIKRINYTTINLTKISQINQFSRVFTSTDLSIEDGFEQLKVINAGKSYPFYARVIAALLVGACLVPTYGGNLSDMLFAAIASGVAYCLSAVIDRLQFPPFIRIFISSALAALVGLLFFNIGASSSVTPILLASVTIFMPGVAITNASRDLLSGDMLSGMARCAEALISAIAIAGGIGFMMKIWIVSFGPFSTIDSYTYPIPLFVLFGFFSAIAFSILFRAPLKQFVVISIIGAIGMLVNVGGGIIGYGDILTCFVGSCIMAILAEITSRLRKDATTLFILPGIIPFVPGKTLYQAMVCVLEGDFAGAASSGSEALIISGSIAIALIFVTSSTRLINVVIRRVKLLLKEKKTTDESPVD